MCAHRKSHSLGVFFANNKPDAARRATSEDDAVLISGEPEARDIGGRDQIAKDFVISHYQMVKRGDRVKLTARAAAAFNNNKRPSMFDWTARRGVVERITTNKANAVVLWDGRKSTEVVPIRSVELEPELGLPQTEHRL